MEGVEIVITPRIIERVIYITIIIALVVLLVLRWDGSGSSQLSQSNGDAQVIAAVNETNETAISASAAMLTPCENNIKDAGETDVDCGGACGACKEFQTCNLDTDCETELYCFQHIKCLRPSCDDGIKNQDETNIDCGGVCKGYFWATDSKCHTTAEPSGLLELTLKADITKSPNSGSAIIKSVTLNFENGLGKAASGSGQIFFRDVGGSVIYATPQGDEISVDDFTISLKDAEKKTLKLDFTNSTRNTLSGIKSTEKFEVYVIVKDSVKKTTLTEATWVNGE